MKRFHKYELTKILLNVNRIMSSSLDLDRVSDTILKESAKALNADHASLFLTNEKLKRLVLVRAIGLTGDDIGNIKLLGSWEVINSHVVKRKRPLIVNDVTSNRIFRNKNLPFFKEALPIKSFIASPLKSDNSVVGVLIIGNRKRPGHLFTRKDVKLLAGLSNYIAMALLNAKVYQRLKDLYVSTVTSLVRAVDAKDRYTRGHSERVMKYALAIGKEMNLDKETYENLRLSSLLHDIGKIGIKESVLDKPGRLSRAEKNQIIGHPSIGTKIVESIDDFHNIIKGIRDHHERFDGKGYPGHLKGETISIEGRIIAIADTFDAITTDRPYQRHCTEKEAFFEIINASSTQFDPQAIKAFILSFSKRPETWRSTG